jgi:hypothetical protein
MNMQNPNNQLADNSNHDAFIQTTSPLPVMEVAITLLYTKEIPADEMNAYLDKLAAGFEKLYPDHIIRHRYDDFIVPVTLTFSTAPFPEDALNHLSTPQRIWMINESLYLQATPVQADYDEEIFAELLTQEFFMPMVWLDTLMGAVDDGQTSLTLMYLVQRLSMTMSREIPWEELELSPVIVLQTGTLGLRNTLLVKARAILEDRDPDDTYRRFEEQGGEYFLDYARIIPPVQLGLGSVALKEHLPTTNRVPVALEPATALITPFNISVKEYEAMINDGVTPPNLLIHVSMLVPTLEHAESLTDRQKMLSMFLSVLEPMTLEDAPGGIQSLSAQVNLSPFPICQLDYLSAEQKRWMASDGCYLQISFLDGSRANDDSDLHIAAVAMTELDAIIDYSDLNIETGTKLSHNIVCPVILGSGVCGMNELVGSCPEVLRSEYARLIQSGIIAWNAELANFRNVLLIWLKGVLDGRNPDKQVEQFKRGGGNYFLQYADLCKPQE